MNSKTTTTACTRGFFGFAAPTDFLASRDAVRSNPNHAHYEFALCDFTDMDTDCIWALTPEIADSVGERNADSPRNQEALRKLALVSSSQKVLDLLAHYVEHHMSAPHAEARLFRSLAQAWSWIKEDTVNEPPVRTDHHPPA